MPERAVDKNVSRRLRGSLHQLTFNVQLPAKLEQRARGAETLRPKFEQESIMAFRTDDPAGTRRRFNNLRVYSTLSQRIGANQSADAAADNQS